MAKQFRAQQLEDLAGMAPKILAQLRSRVVLLHGAMGAGKTTLAAALCRALGVYEAVTSPTYALVNHYLSDTGESIYHFDWYRIAAPEEALDIGLEDYLESGALCLIEWPEKISNFLPSNCDEIFIEAHAATRIITVKPAKHE